MINKKIVLLKFFRTRKDYNLQDVQDMTYSYTNNQKLANNRIIFTISVFVSLNCLMIATFISNSENLGNVRISTYDKFIN